jgi:hypothetical protein
MLIYTLFFAILAPNDSLGVTHHQTTQESEYSMTGVSLQKVQAEAPHLVSLVKETQTIVQNHGLDLSQVKAAVVGSFDDSGSAEGLYRDGTMQTTADMVFAAGLVFDDDGEVPVSFFSSTSKDLGDITLGNSKGFIQKLVKKRVPRWEGTSYVAALQWVINEAGYGRVNLGSLGGRGGLFGRRGSSLEVKAQAEYPTFAFIVTDGDPQDGDQAAELLTLMSQLPIFIQWVGVGPHNFRYLKKLDDLDGRLIDNAGFVDAKDARNERQMLEGLLNEFPQYLIEARKVGLLK